MRLIFIATDNTRYKFGINSNFRQILNVIQYFAITEYKIYTLAPILHRLKENLYKLPV